MDVVSPLSLSLALHTEVNEIFMVDEDDDGCQMEETATRKSVSAHFSFHCG
jgi:hypothetical protein